MAYTLVCSTFRVRVMQCKLLISKSIFIINFICKLNIFILYSLCIQASNYCIEYFFDNFYIFCYHCVNSLGAFSNG